MSTDRDQALDDCGACVGIALATPRPIDNRPGLRAIAYRVATHADVLRSLQAALSDARRPALAPLRTREAGDFTLALFDAFACMADVLTFYQERIANELFLRTATERRSVLELARLLGYELRPGVAASTYLAFHLERGPGAPERAPIPIGTRAQSLPGPGEVPQTFETVEPIEDAAGEWNELRARPGRRQSIDAATTSAYVQGTATNVLVGDPILLIDPTQATPPHALRTVRRVTVDAAADRTLLAWDDGPGFTSSATQLHVLRQRAALFGHNAPDWRAMPANVQRAYLGLSGDADPPITQTEWPGLTIGSVTAGVGLLQECHAGTALSDLRETRVDARVQISGGFDPPVPGIGNDQFSSRWTGVLTPERSGSYVFHVTGDDGVRLYLDGVRVIDAWVLQSPTEHTSAPVALVARRRHAIAIEFFENLGGAVLELRWTPPGGVKEQVPRSLLAPFDPDATIHLDAPYPKLAPDSWLVLTESGNTRAFQVQGVAPDSRSRFTVSSKTTRVTLRGAGLSIFDDKVRSTVVLAQSEPLALAEMPDASPVQGHVDLDRRLLALPAKGRQVLVAGLAQRPGPPPAEVYVVERAVIASVADDTTGLVARTRLVFETDLAERYRRDTVRVYGNVALATHGETVPLEVLGSGDAGRPHQRFTLRNGPLTYTSAPTPSGGASTLTVRVDGIAWTSVPALFGRGPTERVYATRLSDDAQTTVQFGDGRSGARLPTGTENVVASLRKGLGAQGNLGAGRLTLLPARPHGVKEVTNPGPAEGGQDPQTLDDARQNVPRSAITLDRIVSLQDYQDFARDFSGIGKALASITVRGESLGVLLTIAGSAGETISSTGKLRRDLLEAIARAGDGAVAVDARSFRPAWFTVRGGVLVKPEHDPDAVLAGVAQALRARFSFAARELGQPVASSEVIGVIQDVPGVVMVDLDQLAREDGAAIPGRPGYLPSAAPAPYSDAATAQPAELLLLLEGGLDLRVIS